MINELNTEIENFINSDNEWMRKTYEVDEAKTHSEFLTIVKEFINKIKTPYGHRKFINMDRCLLEGRNSRIKIYFKFINQNASKSVTSIDGVFVVNVL